jgi:hypothetical protein
MYLEVSQFVWIILSWMALIVLDESQKLNGT